MYSSTQSDEGRPHGPRVRLRWWKLHWLASAACCSCVFCSLSSGCLVYGAFVAAVAAMVSVLAWACLGCSFLAFCFQVLFNKNAIKRKQKAKTSPAGLLGLILALWPIRGSESSYLIFAFVFRFKTLRLFSFCFRYNISDNFCVACTHTAFFYQKSKRLFVIADNISDKLCVVCTGP